MLSPFAPHTAEELWQMLGHAGGLTTAAVAGVRCRRRRRPTKSSCRCRSTARSARALTVPAGATDDELRDARARRCRSSRTHIAGKTIRKVVVAKGPLVSRWSCNESSASAVLCASASCAACGERSCGYSLAGRGSFLPASIKTIGIPTFANRTTVFNLETTLTQKVRSEFIGRGKYDIVPGREQAWTRLLTGEVTAVTISPSSFNASQLASRYADRHDGAESSCGTCATNMVLWDNPSLVFRQECDAAGGAAADGAVDPPRSSARIRRRSIA